MNFALIGYDASADEFVQAALARSHRLVAVVDVPSELPLPPFPQAIRLLSLEELPGIGGIDCILLSGRLDGRAERLRYVLRLDPVDLVLATPVALRPDVCYEASLLKKETGIHLYPLLAEAAHPAWQRIEARLGGAGSIRLLEWTQPAVPLSMAGRVDAPAQFVHGWYWLRRLGGEIVEVAMVGSAGDAPGAGTIASVRFQSGLLATVRWQRDPGEGCHLRVATGQVRIECEFPGGMGGPARLRWEGMAGGEETIEPAGLGSAWLEHRDRCRQAGEEQIWVAATRQLELADAAARSLRTGRAVSLAYEGFSEEAGFKSVMTLAGCGLIWLTLLVVILAAVGVPYVGHLILPVLGVFLGMQLLGLVFRTKSEPRAARSSSPPQSSNQ